MVIRTLIGLLALVVPLAAAEVSGIVVPSDSGNFSVPHLMVKGEGKAKKLGFRWKGSGVNETGHDWFKVTLCVRAFGADGKMLTADGDECMLRVVEYDWENGRRIKWCTGARGCYSPKVKVGEGGEEKVKISSIEVSVKELLTYPAEIFTQTCEEVWPAALQAFADSGFQLTTSDKNSFVASFENDDAREGTWKVWGNVEAISKYTINRDKFVKFRIDSTSLVLKTQPDKGCRAEIKMAFAGFMSSSLTFRSWYRLTSNEQFERRLLKAISVNLGKEAQQD